MHIKIKVIRIICTKFQVQVYFQIYWRSASSSKSNVWNEL